MEEKHPSGLNKQQRIALNARVKKNSKVVRSMVGEKRYDEIADLMSKNQKIIDNKLYGHVFHFNHNTGKWAAIPRGLEKDYFNDMSQRVHTGIIFSKDINDLIGYLYEK